MTRKPIKRKPPAIAASQLVDLLAVRHSGDVFVPECKTGPTHDTHGMQRLDAWAMKKSWAHPLTVGYEIKVARSDFLSDNKWRGYLPYCNEFVFVAPPGVIDVGEIPEEAGLLVSSVQATRLYTKKKAPYRAVEIPDSLYRYVLFSRVRVTREWQDTEGGAAEFWQRWLSDKRELEGLGHRVSRALSSRMSEEIDRRDAKQRQLDREIEKLADARKMLTDLGFAPGVVPEKWRLQSQLERLREVLPPAVLGTVRNAVRALQKVDKALGDVAVGDDGE